MRRPEAIEGGADWDVQVSTAKQRMEGGREEMEPEGPTGSGAALGLSTALVAVWRVKEQAAASVLITEDEDEQLSQANSSGARQQTKDASARGPDQIPQDVATKRGRE